MAKKLHILDETPDLTPKKFDRARTMMTGKRVSTLTPENSEAPRESVAGIARTEEQMVFDDAAVTGNGFMRGGLRVDPADVYLSTKTSSPELASLAAKYVNIDNSDMYDLAACINEPEGSTDFTKAQQFFEDVRSLAASVLAQAEGTPRK